MWSDFRTIEFQNESDDKDEVDFIQNFASDIMESWMLNTVTTVMNETLEHDYVHQQT